jgi:hypothetical protein
MCPSLVLSLLGNMGLLGGLDGGNVPLPSINIFHLFSFLCVEN